jgi:hypothetical protein
VRKLAPSFIFSDIAYLITSLVSFQCDTFIYIVADHISYLHMEDVQVNVALD